MDDEIEIEEDESGYATKIAKLKKDLEVCRQEKDDYLGGWKRAKADYMNAERDFATRLESASQYAEITILKELLEIADGFDNAFAFPPTGGPPESKWLDGMKGIRNQIERIFTKYGVTKINALHSEFDPSIHEAVELVKVDREAEDNQVVGEVQSGYKMRDRVLRPVRVKVAKFEK